MQKTKNDKEMEPGRAFVVSIHDVSPFTRERTGQILDDLKSCGLPCVSLLVVPDHHHRGQASEDPEFSRWLASACAQGHEAVLHGYFHLRKNRATDGPVKRLITRSYTAGEGEFLDLSKADARELLHRGKRVLEACGVTPRGFIAPAWLLGREAEQAVQEAEFQYTTRIATVSDFVTGSVYRSRSQVWSVRAGWRRICSLGWNALLFQQTLETPLTRMGIHPPDWDHPQIRRQILHLLGKALAARRPMTYEQWVNRTRTVP